MRLGISGSHATGKSTLAAELRSALPQWTFIEEAYSQLLEEGHGFGAAVTSDDIEAQLRRSIDLIESTRGSDTVFERCPVDYLAYLTALRAGTETLQFWFQESRSALASLDAVILLPVERPDRIFIGSDELPKLRRAVDRHLRAGLVEDAWGLKLTVHECYGSPSDRLGQALNWIKAGQVPARSADTARATFSAAERNC